MRTRLGAAVLGVLAGLMLIAGGGLSFLAGDRSDWHHLLAVGGYAAALGALLLVGYGLAGTAPVWLRLIVGAGLPLLAGSVWQVIAEEADKRSSTWRGAASAYLAAGVLMLLLGLLMARRAASEERRYHPTHR